MSSNKHDLVKRALIIDGRSARAHGAKWDTELIGHHISICYGKMTYIKILKHKAMQLIALGYRNAQ